MISLAAELQQPAGQQWQSCSSPCLLWSKWVFLGKDQPYHIPSFLEASVNIQRESVTISLGLGGYTTVPAACYMPSVHITNSLICLLQVTAVNKHKSLAARAHLELNSGIGSCQRTDFCGSIAVIWMNYRPQYPFVSGLWARGVEQIGLNGWNLIQASASFSKAMHPSSVWLFCVVYSISM